MLHTPKDGHSMAARNFTTRDGTVLTLDDRYAVFNHVMEKLDDQGVRCTSGMACTYRADIAVDNETKSAACAVGWLMPDSVYDDLTYDIRTGGVMTLFESSVARKHFGAGFGITYDDVIFLKALQKLHDTAENWVDGAITKNARKTFLDNFVFGETVSELGFKIDVWNEIDRKAAAEA